MPRHFVALVALAALAFPLITLAPPAAAAEKKSKGATKAAASSAKAKPKVSQDDAVRLQIFLDRQNFGPGKIDGAYGGFTKLAWLHWQQAHGIEKPQIETLDPAAPQLAGIDPIYISYTVAAEDLANLGPVPSSPAEQAKLKALTYQTLSELLGERFHSSPDFLKKLNAGKNLDAMKEGDTVTVPNVQPPFDLAQVAGWKNLQRAQAAANQKKDAEKKPAGAGAANGSPTPTPPASQENPTASSPSPSSPSPGSASSPAASPTPGAGGNANGAPVVAMPALPVLSPAAFVHISVKECYLELRDGDRIVAAFPVTPGSKAIPTPIGEWKIVGKALFPEFRWDKEMLEHGKRSKDAYELPPGPNSPVGIAWMQLNKPGIGMHGTGEPDTIGRSASHGCVRLANWDAFKLYNMVQKGMKVVIE